jgi:hypothetical protein
MQPVAAAAVIAAKQKAAAPFVAKKKIAGHSPTRRNEATSRRGTALRSACYS